jgi:hypothetical protein
MLYGAVTGKAQPFRTFMQATDTTPSLKTPTFGLAEVGAKFSSARLK